MINFRFFYTSLIFFILFQESSAHHTRKDYDTKDSLMVEMGRPWKTSESLLDAFPITALFYYTIKYFFSPGIEVVLTKTDDHINILPSQKSQLHFKRQIDINQIDSFAIDKIKWGKRKSNPIFLVYMNEAYDRDRNILKQSRTVYTFEPLVKDSATCNQWIKSLEKNKAN